PLGLNHTRVGTVDLGPGDLERMAAGYKIGFFKAIRFDAPVFRGNTPAGYIISNGDDMGRWLKVQLGLEPHPLTPLVEKSHERDKTVSPNTANLLSYAMGWMVNLDGSGTILHGALNPNFTSYIVLKPEDKTGVMVLANSNSGYTAFIGRAVMNLLYGKDTPLTADLGDGLDKGSSLASFFFIFYLLCAAIFLVWVVIGIVKGSRRFEPVTPRTVAKWMFPLFGAVPFLVGIYWLPRALAGFTWESSLVWAPVSFKLAVILMLIAAGAGYFNYFFSLLFPQQNKYLRSIPTLVLLSIAGGVANAVVIFLITSALFTTLGKDYLLFYFFLAATVYIVGRKVLQTRLIEITNTIVYDMRVKLVEKIFHTSYQRFEKIEGGRILATLNNDTGQIGNSAGIFVAIVSSGVTVIGAFVYLATVAFWATVVTLAMVVTIAAIYSLVSRKANVYLNAARNTQNTYMTLLTGLQDGFKELSLHYTKKTAFKSDVEGICAEFKEKVVIASVKFVNGFMIGETLLIAVLASVGFAVPVLFPQIKILTLMGFVMVLLYLIGPVTSILNSIPGIMQIRIAWNRVNELMRDIPANMTPEDMALPSGKIDTTAHIKAKNVFFEYESQDESEKFTVGPVDFEADRGEIVFIVGGNGSGKTTLAKLLTGLYIPDKGTITVNGNIINNYQLGEYFSVVFGDYHLFEKLYDVDLAGKDKKTEAWEYLKLLRLDKKVRMETDKFSTVNLSGGQRKRLALLRCYLEDRPIYLFDEVAADQDPEFRKFFYRDLLKKMKERGKTVIAITHDDHYFDVADRVVKMDMGKIELIGEDAALIVTK
ncbi:MAG: cyclic peptide export ABC transporter, partial [bacterium]|nr:cyclic peptide export ABC transporter [bacterium]